MQISSIYNQTFSKAEALRTSYFNNEKTVQKTALPIISLNGECNVPGTGAGPIAWAACIAICEATAATATVATAGAAAPSLIACVAACGPLLALPFPP